MSTNLNLSKNSLDNASLHREALKAGSEQPEGSQHAAACLNLSHELRTPAHAILGQIDLLLSGSAGPLSSDLRAGLGDIQRAALTLSAQITKIIELAEAIPGPGLPDAEPGP